MVEPKRPYSSFPLTPHANRQFCRKTHGKVHSSGICADPQAALDCILAVAPDLRTGRQPRQGRLSRSELTVKDECYAFLDWQKNKLDAGEIGVH